MRKFIHGVFDPFMLGVILLVAVIITNVQHLGTGWFFGIVGIGFASHVVFEGFSAIHRATADKEPPKK